MPAIRTLRDPWPDIESVRHFLRSLIGAAEAQFTDTYTASVAPQDLAPWLERQGLGALAYRHYAASWPALAELLKPSYFITAAKNSIHMKRLHEIANQFAHEGIPVLPLKGAALSQWIYPDIGLRPMSDIDLWVRGKDMPAAARAMAEAGYVEKGKTERPIALQQLAGGERAFASSDRHLVELHWAPFSGWWLHYAASVDEAALWSGLQEVRPAEVEASEARLAEESSSSSWYTLSPEDTVLHLAWHLGINHQFGMWPVRSLVDVALLMRRCTINWPGLVERAQKWRLTTVLWSVLQLVDELIGHHELEPVLEALRPSAWRRQLLSRHIAPELLISGRDLSKGAVRYFVLLLLVDRPRDMLRLALRTIWPEKWWLEARYGQEGAGNWHHLWRVLRHGEI